jgi:hypothetical protein
MLITKLNDLLASPSQADSKLPDLEGASIKAPRQQSWSTHTRPSKTHRSSTQAALQPEQWQKLIGLHQTRVKGRRVVWSSSACTAGRWRASKPRSIHGAEARNRWAVPWCHARLRRADSSQVTDIVTRAKANAAGPAPELDVNKFCTSRQAIARREHGQRPDQRSSHLPIHGSTPLRCVRPRRVPRHVRLGVGGEQVALRGSAQSLARPQCGGPGLRAG